MASKIILVFFCFIVVLIPTTNAEAPIVPPEAPKLPPKAVLSVNELITASSIKYSVKRKIIADVIQCESTGKINAVGDGGRSFGLVQIFLPAHPEITKEQALDPVFAVDYLAKELSRGRGSAWTCWRLLVSSPLPKN